VCGGVRARVLPPFVLGVKTENNAKNSTFRIHARKTSYPQLLNIQKSGNITSTSL
jgi:hypothetical protein